MGGKSMRDLDDAPRYTTAQNQGFAPLAGIPGGTNTFKQCLEMVRE